MFQMAFPEKDCRMDGLASRDGCCQKPLSPKSFLSLRDLWPLRSRWYSIGSLSIGFVSIPFDLEPG